jgi:D-aminopeptidase
VGVLVQSNFGGELTIGGVRVPNGIVERADGRTGAPARGAGDDPAVRPHARTPARPSDGSIMIVIATDAPLDARALDRLAQRAFLGVARTGSWMANGSGDFAIAFSTAPEVRRGPAPRGAVLRPPAPTVTADLLSPLFQAVVEATEEAIVNSLFRATTVRAADFTADALPLDSVLSLLREHRVLR